MILIIYFNRILSPEEKFRKKGRLLNWEDLYFPIGCGMVKGGVPTNIMVVQRPDGRFGPATDPTVSFVPVTAQPESRLSSVSGGQYQHSHQIGSHSGSTSFNYNKPGNHGNHNRDPNSNGEFQFSHQHVGPSGMTSVNFNYHGVGEDQSGGLRLINNHHFIYPY